MCFYQQNLMTHQQRQWIKPDLCIQLQSSLLGRRVIFSVFSNLYSNVMRVVSTAKLGFIYSTITNFTGQNMHLSHAEKVLMQVLQTMWNLSCWQDRWSDRVKEKLHVSQFKPSVRKVLCLVALKVSPHSRVKVTFSGQLISVGCSLGDKCFL